MSKRDKDAWCCAFYVLSVIVWDEKTGCLLSDVLLPNFSLAFVSPLSRAVTDLVIFETF
jgi:hypothetical protein